VTAITGSDVYFTNIDAGFSATKWEVYIQQAIDKINGYARDTILPNMTGAAGSKTVTVTSKEAGFIRSLTIALYHNEFIMAGAKSTSDGVSGLSRSQSGGEVETLAKDAAFALKENDWSNAFI
jgi:hypothetical protein